jgi:hypothetical protein
MGFFSRLCKSFSPQGHELQIPWCAEARGRPVELSQPLVQVTVTHVLDDD